MVGNPNDQLLPLLHGGLGNIADFNIILASIPTQFKLIGIDFRGHDKSTLGSTELSYQLYQSDVEVVLTYLNIDRFLDSSEDDIVGYQLVAKTPTKVRQLMTLGAQWRLQVDDPS